MKEILTYIYNQIPGKVWDYEEEIIYRKYKSRMTTLYPKETS